MAVFGNKNNNANDNKKDVNTRSFQLYSQEGFDPSTLVLGFWNDFFSMKIHPALESDKRNEKNIYDYDKMINLVFTANTAIMLLDGLKNKILPAIEQDVKEDISIAIPMKNGTNLIEVGNGYKFTKTTRPYVSIYKNLDPDTKIPTQEIAFEFMPSESYKNYDNRTGSFETYSVNSDLLMFIEYLENGINALTKGYAHASRDTLKYVISKMFENQKAIMDKLGIETKSYGNNNYNNYSRKITNDKTEFNPMKKSQDIDQVDDFDVF